MMVARPDQGQRQSESVTGRQWITKHPFVKGIGRGAIPLSGLGWYHTIDYHIGVEWFYGF